MLADALRKFLFDLDVDDGLAALGYSKADIPALVKGTLPQVRDMVCVSFPAEKARASRKRHAPFRCVRGMEILGFPGSTQVF